MGKTLKLTCLGSCLWAAATVMRQVREGLASGFKAFLRLKISPFATGYYSLAQSAASRLRSDADLTEFFKPAPATLPGMLLVHPLIKKKVAEYGRAHPEYFGGEELRMDEHGVWLVVVAVKVYINSVLEGVVSRKDGEDTTIDIRDIEELLRSSGG